MGMISISVFIIVVFAGFHAHSGEIETRDCNLLLKLVSGHFISLTGTTKTLSYGPLEELAVDPSAVVELENSQSTPLSPSIITAFEDSKKALLEYWISQRSEQDRVKALAVLAVFFRKLGLSAENYNNRQLALGKPAKRGTDWHERVISYFENSNARGDSAPAYLTFALDGAVSEFDEIIRRGSSNSEESAETKRGITINRLDSYLPNSEMNEALYEELWHYNQLLRREAGLTKDTWPNYGQSFVASDELLSPLHMGVFAQVALLTLRHAYSSPSLEEIGAKRFSGQILISEGLRILEKSKLTLPNYYAVNSEIFQGFILLLQSKLLSTNARFLLNKLEAEYLRGELTAYTTSGLGFFIGSKTENFTAPGAEFSQTKVAAMFSDLKNILDDDKTEQEALHPLIEMAIDGIKKWWPESFAAPVIISGKSYTVTSKDAIEDLKGLLK